MLTPQILDTGSLQLHYAEGPHNGPTLLLLHGASGDWTAWRDLMPRLAERWHVCALDLRGHGQSGRAASLDGYHLTAFAQDVLAFLRQRAALPAVLCGQSWGGMVALAAAAQAPELLRGLMLIDPAIGVMRATGIFSVWFEYFDWVRAALLADPRPEALAETLLQSGRRPGYTLEQALPWAVTKSMVDPRFLEAMTTTPVTSGFDLAAALQAVTCPLTLLYGNPARGGVLDPADVQQIQASARQPSIHYFDNAGHDPHIDNPAEFIAALEAFAAR